MATQHGGMGKRLLAGKAAQSGTLSAVLAANGFTNVPNIFECEYGGFCSAFSGGRDTYHLDELTRGLGQDWNAAELNFKMWSCRVPIHPTLEALRKLREESGLTEHLDSFAGKRSFAIDPGGVRSKYFGRKAMRDTLPVGFLFFDCEAFEV